MDELQTYDERMAELQAEQDAAEESQTEELQMLDSEEADLAEQQRELNKRRAEIREERDSMQPVTDEAAARAMEAGFAEAQRGTSSSLWRGNGLDVLFDDADDEAA